MPSRDADARRTAQLSLEEATAPWQARLAAGETPSSWLVRDKIERLGGAGLIDVKERDNGPLGFAGVEVIAAVLRAVGGRRPVSAALGEFCRERSASADLSFHETINQRAGATGADASVSSALT